MQVQERRGWQPIDSAPLDKDVSLFVTDGRGGFRTHAGIPRPAGLVRTRDHCRRSCRRNGRCISSERENDWPPRTVCCRATSFRLVMRVAAMSVAYDAGRPLAIHAACTFPPPLRGSHARWLRWVGGAASQHQCEIERDTFSHIGWLHCGAATCRQLSDGVTRAPRSRASCDWLRDRGRQQLAAPVRAAPSPAAQLARRAAGPRHAGY
jgi:hypothetical protein